MATKKAATKENAVKETTVKATAVEEAVKDTTVTAEKKVAEKKAPAKTAAKKAPAKTAAAKENMVLQFAGKEIEAADISKKVKEYWTKELKNKVGDMKSVTIYVKPEESMAYFVINGDVTGSVAL